MLVCQKLLGGTLEQMAQRLVLTIFPFLEKEFPDVPFIKKIDNILFCYEHQFTIKFEVTEIEFKFSPIWFGHPEDDEKMERAICALHPYFNYRKSI